MRTRRRTSIGFLTTALALGVVPVAVGQLSYPQLRTISPPGGQAGQTLEVSIGGSDLEECTELVFSHPGIRSERIESTAASEFRPVQYDPVRYRVHIDAAVPEGSYDATARTRLGFTAPHAFAVGSLPEINHTANNSLESAMALPLDTVVNGQADAEAIDYYKLDLTVGQRVLIQCRAEPIDSKMDATLTISDSDGRELMRDRDTLGRDAVLAFTAPAAGTYIVRVFDFTFAGGPEYPYRLGASGAPHIDFIYPPAGPPGTTQKFKIYGRNLPGGSKGEGVRLGPHELESIEVDVALAEDANAPLVARSLHTSLLRGMDYRLEGNGQKSNPVRIGFATAPIVPAEESQSEQSVTIPCEIHGRFDTRGDLDRYRFEAKKGSSLWIEALAERLGGSTDPLLFVERITRDDKGTEQAGEVASNDDAGSGSGGRYFSIDTRDPALRFTPPEDGTYRVNIVAQAGKGGPAALYRLVLREARPEFDLISIPWLATNPDKQVNCTPAILRQGGTALVRVFAMRRDGFDGEIELTVEGLPPGVTCPPVTVRKGQDVETLIFSCAADAASWQGFVTIKGTAGDLVREARAGAISWPVGNYEAERTMSRLATRLPLSVYGGEKAPVVVQVAQQKWEVELGGNLEIPIKLEKNLPVKGDFVIQPEGLPYKNNKPTIKINEQGTDGKITLNFAKTGDFPIEPGEWRFALSGSGIVKYRNNVAGIARAEEEQKKVEELDKKYQEELKQATAAVEPARKAVQEAEKNLQSASDEAKAELEAAVAKSKTQLQEAEIRAKEADEQAKRSAAENKAAADRVKQAGERAKTVELKHGTYSIPLTVVVKSPPPKEEGK